MMAEFTKHREMGAAGAQTLGILCFLALAGMNVGGCATGGVLEYQPLEQTSTASVAARWHALQALVGKEDWMVVSGDRKKGTLEALVPTADAEGIRDRIKVTLLAEKTVVEVRSEIQSAGVWHMTPFRCPSYHYFREANLVARLDGSPSFDADVAFQRPTLILARR
jgi:hypothetical protein